MSNTLEFIVRLKDLTKRGFNSVGKNLAGFRDRINNSIKNLFSFRKVLLLVTAAAGMLALSLKKAFEMERYNTQFKVLLGSLDAAKRHMKELADFSAQTPFQLGEIAKASRQLIVFTGGVLGGKESLELIGDAAAATGTNIADLSMWVGRAYSSIKAGRPWGEAAMRLQELGVLSSEARGELEDMTKAGASNIDVWMRLQRELEKSKGGMKELSQTGEGLFSTLKDNWTLALAEFGSSFMDLAKGGITDLINMIKRLREDGTLAVWADNASTALNNVKTTVETLVGAFTKLGEKTGFFDFVRNVVGGIEGIAAGIGAASTGAGPGEVIDQMGIALDNRTNTAKKKAREAKIKAEATAKNQAIENEKSLAENIVADLSKFAKQKQLQSGNLAAAQAAAGSAWAAYLSPQEFARQERERKFKKESEAKFAKESDWIGRQASAYGIDYLREQGDRWRSSMSAKDKAIYDVVKTRMEEDAAKKSLQDIEKNTRETKDLLEANLTRGN